MKVKVGNRIYDGEQVPVMVVLSNDDKANIANMAPDATMYAKFPDGWGDKDEMESWMTEK